MSKSLQGLVISLTIRAGVTLISAIALLISCNAYSPASPSSEHINVEYLKLTEDLLTEWVDAMMLHQIDNPEDTAVHGALMCPACNKIHGRCMDAVYPFMFMADHTGDTKYLDAAIKMMQWSENVSMPDGSWTVMPDPKSWKGISVFGAIALAESLQHHGHILPQDIKAAWTDRLSKVGEYIYTNFYMGYSHINYGITSIYALYLIGDHLNKPEYLEKASAMAQEIPNWISKNDSLIYGEDSPPDKLSSKGLPAIDLGYNVEETLNGSVLYAKATDNHQLLNLLETVLNQHLLFLLPDGGWDNSWGSRQNKWSYWGSRTTDGCQPAFAMMADRNPALGTAAFRNTELLQTCTVDGLLAGGLHYKSYDVKPCIHHTFAHAKSLAYILDNAKDLPSITNVKVPREFLDGVKHYSDLDVWIANKGSWTATISSYDNVFKTAGSNQATGGSLSMLYHQELGPILAGSMAKYLLAEKNNQQPQPGVEFSTTPRLESENTEKWYTNLYDLEADVQAIESSENIKFKIATSLTDKDRNKLSAAREKLSYTIARDYVQIKVEPSNKNIRFVLPLISPSSETYVLNSNDLILHKPRGSLRVESSLPISIMQSDRGRIFNMVPGIEVIPAFVEIPAGDPLTINLLIDKKFK